MSAPTDRYEPLPGLFGLPGHFLRKLSPRGRKLVAVLGVLLLAGAVAATIVLAPRISESKREHAAAEREARARAALRARAQLIAEQRPRRGRVPVRGAPGPAAVTAAVEGAITRDARARVATGELENPARRTDCRSLGTEGGRLLLSCTAVTSEVESTEEISGVIVGYSYRAAISTDSGRYALCKTSGRPAVGFSGRQLPPVELPEACG
jgi:Tfp pilus assembly protein PilX